MLDATAAGGGFTGLSTNNATLAKNILYDLTGSITSMNEAFPVLSSKDPKLVDWRTGSEQSPLVVSERNERLFQG